MKRKNDKIIWTNDVNVKDWENDFRECFELEADEEIQNDVFYKWIDETISSYLEDTKMNLNIITNNPIICIAQLGLWNGVKIGHKVVGYNVKDIFTVMNDVITFKSYNKNIIAEGSHHDGNNFYIFRELKEGRNLDNFLDKIYHSTKENYMQIVRNYTNSIDHYIKNVYGW